MYINNDCKAHFYADDTILYTYAPSVEQAVSDLQCAFEYVQKSLKKLRLVLNESWTKLNFCYLQG